MARKHEAPDAIEELNSLVDRSAAWVVHNRVLVLAVAGTILGLAAAYGIYETVTRRSERAGSTALALARAEFAQAMGGSPDASEIPEPANPELAQRLRREYAGALARVAEEHSGTRAEVVAQLLAGNRLAETGDEEGALAAWEAARDAAPGGSSLEALVLLRLAAAYEAQARVTDAAAAFEGAGEVEAFPLRYHALAEAARVHADAGAEERAVALLDRIEADGHGAAVPEYVRSQVRELSP